MIKDFIRQTNASIVNFMLNMNKRKRTYAAHVTGLEPFDEKTHLYLYATKHELVVVCLDDGGRQLDELADEETFCDEQPLYFNADGNRVSPVYHLKAVMRQLYSRLTADFGRQRPQIWGIMLTSSRLINRPDMIHTWYGMRISVFDQQTGLPHLRNLPLNDSDQLAGAPYLAHLKPYFAKDDDAPSDEFERMLSEFIESEFNKLDDDAAEPDPQADDADSTPDDADSTPDSDVDESDDVDELTSDFGELELNPNNIVKVEVLQPMRHPEREMQRIVGCQAVKRHIDELIMLNQYNVRMHLLNPEAKPHELSLHSIFLGRPGTGKTTVCKIMGSLLHQAGMLSRGHVVVANRGTFVGSNWGDEERAVRRVVEMARGGVLMIDEAYLLNGDNRNDPGRMVLPMLMDILSDERQRDLAIVLCGYKQQMLRLLELNPGLESRFPNRFEFEDFTVDELLDITQRRIADHGYTFTPQAWDDYTQLIAEAHRSRDPQTWGNARFVANQLERIYLCHAQRCISADINDREQLFQLTPADIQPIQVARPKPRMGF
ncbi:MAG: AAA family ATPase [Prevotella sp.]|nr:AAA family ATPase [Prevotella sp.]